MKPNNGSRSDYVLRLRTYEQFSDLQPRVAADILKRLGIRGGFMRRYALKYNPKVVVVFERNEQIVDGEMDGELCSCVFWQPIGWLTLTRAGAWHSRLPAVQCFVLPEYREVAELEQNSYNGLLRAGSWMASK